MSAVSNAKWVSLSQVARILSQLANIFVLARLLPPSDYGVMAMATVVTNLALLLKDQGTSAALIQKQDLSHATINTVFWFNVAVGVTIAICIVILAPAMALYFNQPTLLGVLCALAVIFPISSSSTSHQALLERQSSFKKLALIEVSASIVAMVLAIIGAINGMGVYSLVLQAISMALLTTMLLWMTSDWRPKGKARLQEFREILPFTGHMTGFQLITYFFRNADGLIIGRLLGAAQLGIYSMAYKVMLLPVQNITWAASRALFPVMSRQQSSPQEMGHLYLQAIAFISFITAPLMVCIFVLREPFVSLAFGPQWSEASGVLMWLAPIGFLQSISSIGGTIFMAQGKTKLLMWISLLSALIHIGAFILGANTGIQGVARYYLFASVLTVIPTLVLAARLVGRGLNDIIHALWRPIVASLVLGMFEYFLHANIHSYIANELVGFCTLVMLGIIFYIALNLIFFPKMFKSYISKIF